MRTVCLTPYADMRRRALAVPMAAFRLQLNGGLLRGSPDLLPKGRKVSPELLSRREFGRRQMLWWRVRPKALAEFRVQLRIGNSQKCARTLACSINCRATLPPCPFSSISNSSAAARSWLCEVCVGMFDRDRTYDSSINRGSFGIRSAISDLKRIWCDMPGNGRAYMGTLLPASFAALTTNGLMR